MENNNDNSIFSGKSWKDKPSFINLIKNKLTDEEADEKSELLDQLGEKINDAMIKAIKLNPVVFAQQISEQLSPIAAAGMFIILTRHNEIEEDTKIIYVIGKLYGMAVEWKKKENTFKKDEQEAINSILEGGHENFKDMMEEMKEKIESGDSAVLGDTTDNVDALIDAILKRQRTRTELIEFSSTEIDNIKKELGLDGDANISQEMFAQIKHRKEKKILDSIGSLFDEMPDTQQKFIEMLQSEFDDVLTVDDLDKYEGILQRCFDRIKKTIPELEGLNAKQITSTDVMRRIAEKHISLYALITTRNTFSVEGFEHLIPGIDSIIFAIIADIDKDFAKALPDIEKQTRSLGIKSSNPLIEIASKIAEHGIDDLTRAATISSPLKKKPVKAAMEAILEYMIKISK